MPDKYTSQVALLLDEQVDDVGAVVQAAGKQGDIDRASPVRDQGADAQEVHWGGRMQKGVVRRLVDSSDGKPILRTETYVGSEGISQGLSRQAKLLQALARQLRGKIAGVRDLSALADHDEAWMNRLAIGAVEPTDAITVKADGQGTWWLHTHGAARFDVPDLELYGLAKAQIPSAERALRQVHEQLLRSGLKGALSLPSTNGDVTPVYLVPVLEAWQHVPLDWPGVGRAGSDRGPGLDGPRATLSVKHKRRFGRYKTDLEGVVAALPAG